MKRTAWISALAAAILLVACSSDEGPTGISDLRYWDIAWSSPDEVLTDIEMLAPDLGYACGYRYNPTTDTFDGLLYRYDGTGWEVALFLPGALGVKFVALDFAGANNGWALGNRVAEVGTVPVVMHFDGETWAEAPSTGLNGGVMTMLAAPTETDVWVSDGFTAFRFDGFGWNAFALSQGGAVDSWVFSSAEVGFAVDHESGYCYKWDAMIGFWQLETYPLYNVTTYYFQANGSGLYADYVYIPPVTERTNIYLRLPGETPTYKRIYASGVRRLATACDHGGADYYFLAGPNAAFEVAGEDVRPLGHVPSSDLGFLRALSLAGQGDAWGVMGKSLETGPSFIVHKK